MESSFDTPQHIIQAKSGEWRGSYEQYGDDHEFSQDMQFTDGKISGDGNDEIGSYVVTGTWDNVTGQVNINKTYNASHSVPYKGKLSPDGTIIEGTYFNGSGTFRMTYEDPTAL